MTASVNKKACNIDSQRNDRHAGAAHAGELRALFSANEAFFLNAIRLAEPTPSTAHTLESWSEPAVLASWLQRYGDDIYREHAGAKRDDKPLLSLWAQWYFGLLIPPLMLALLKHPQGVDCSASAYLLDIHETGRPAGFYLAPAPLPGYQDASACQRIEHLITAHLRPVVDKLEALGALNGKLIWNNNGYLMYWYLTQLRPGMDSGVLDALDTALFDCETLSDGSDNPLYRTVITRQAKRQRRSCCQRYKLPGVEMCTTCTLVP